MGSRRRGREFALQALYQADIAGTPVAAAFAGLWPGALEGDGLLTEGHVPENDEVEFAQRLAYGVEQQRQRLDDLIEESSINWRVPRMPAVDRNILRLAAFELVECTDIPGSVAINESIELAKKYGTGESKSFVNGIVDKLARTLGRVEGAKRRTTGGES